MIIYNRKIIFVFLRVIINWIFLRCPLETNSKSYKNIDWYLLRNRCFIKSISSRRLWTQIGQGYFEPHWRSCHAQPASDVTNDNTTMTSLSSPSTDNVSKSIVYNTTHTCIMCRVVEWIGLVRQKCLLAVFTRVFFVYNLSHSFAG